MKRCRNCGAENSDAMRFCVECGNALENSPQMVVNLQNDSAQRSNDPPPTVMINSRNTNGKQNFPPNISNVSTQKPKSYGKIFLVIGGIFALFFLLLTAGAAILFFNWQSKKDVIVVSNSPTPMPTRSSEKKSPIPLASISPNDSPSDIPNVSPTITPDENIESPTKSETEASADFDKLWVDYNVTDKNRLGMRIHVKFTVHKMKDVDSFVAIYFQQDNDTKLLTNNTEFRSKDGQVAVYRALKPNFDDTFYEDLQLFIPYTEFNLSRGKYNLKMDADVIYENGDLVQHLTYYNFEYEKQ